MTSVLEMTGALKTLENQRVKVLGSFNLASGLPDGSDDKETACNAEDAGCICVGKISKRREWQSTLVFLPGKSHGQRSWPAMVHGVTKSGN